MGRGETVPKIRAGLISSKTQGGLLHRVIAILGAKSLLWGLRTSFWEEVTFEASELSRKLLQREWEGRVLGLSGCVQKSRDERVEGTQSGLF